MITEDNIRADYPDPARVVDETSITSIETMCHGAVDSLLKRIMELRDEISPILKDTDTLERPTPNLPTAWTDLSRRLVNLYMSIITCENVLQDIHERVHLQ